MKSEAEVRERITQHEDNLRMWQEPDGYLLSTEPDPEERARTRVVLMGAIHELKWLLGECGCCDQPSPFWGLIATSNSPAVAPLFHKG